MTYVVTGATGFIGRHLVEALLSNREGTIFAVVREGAVPRFERLHRSRWNSSDRIRPVIGDLSATSIGVAADWLEQHRGSVSHFFHLAAVYDMTATPERNAALNVAGTLDAVALADELKAGVFHHLSSVAVAGDYRGGFDETMFDEGQRLPTPYHQTKFAAERIVREECPVPWRIYRPAIVVGHSQTGVMDTVDGPYYFFPLLKRLRDTLPQRAPLMSVDLGDTNVVPVDFVATALDHLAHIDGLDGQAFHLVDPVPQAVVDVVNTLAAAARAPRLMVPVDRRVTAALPRSWEPVNVLTSVLGTAPAQRALAETVGRLGVPPELLGQLVLPATFSARATEKALSGYGISCPPVETYAAALWDYWEQHLDPSTASDVALRDALHGRTVVITGVSSGVGKATALKVAQAGVTPLLVACDEQDLLDTQGEIEDGGGSASVYPCDLSDVDAIDALTEQITAKHHTVDLVINAAGCSSGSSAPLARDSFHDFERTMRLKYFGAARLVLGLLPALRESGTGYVITISSIDVQADPPELAAYVASNAARAAWSGGVSAELSGEGIRFTTIDTPLVRTPMVAPETFESDPTITPAQAADLVMAAIKEQPDQINTAVTDPAVINAAVAAAGEAARTLLSKLTVRILDRRSRR